MGGEGSSVGDGRRRVGGGGREGGAKEIGKAKASWIDEGLRRRAGSAESWIGGELDQRRRRAG